MSSALAGLLFGAIVCGVVGWFIRYVMTHSGPQRGRDY